MKIACLTNGYERPNSSGCESRRKGSFRSFVKKEGRRSVRRFLKEDLQKIIEDDFRDAWNMSIESLRSMDYNCDFGWDEVEDYWDDMSLDWLFGTAV